MIISRTPYRISFFGGGTDYPVWFQDHGGAVLATTIDKYCYITCRYLPPFFEHKSRVVYSLVETVSSNSEIKHPAVRGTLGHIGIDEGVEIHHDGDIPARSGMGSSSSFTVGLLNALYALKGRMISKAQLAREAIHIEQQVLCENVGCQDQVMTAHGGLSKIDFFPTHEYRVTPVVVSREKLQQFQSHLLLYFSGFSRYATEVAGEQIKNTHKKGQELREMFQMVQEGMSILTEQRDLSDFGKLLNESWKLKRSLTNKISTSAIDDFYDCAMRNGALGGKLLGAGGGGFMLLFVKPEDQPRVKEVLKDSLLVPFNLENTGSQIISYQPPDQYEESIGQNMDVRSAVISPVKVVKNELDAKAHG